MRNDATTPAAEANVWVDPPDIHVNACIMDTLTDEALAAQCAKLAETEIPVGIFQGKHGHATVYEVGPVSENVERPKAFRVYFAETGKPDDRASCARSFHAYAYVGYDARRRAEHFARVMTGAA